MIDENTTKNSTHMGAIFFFIKHIMLRFIWIITVSQQDDSHDFNTSYVTLHLDGTCQPPPENIFISIFQYIICYASFLVNTRFLSYETFTFYHINQYFSTLFTNLFYRFFATTLYTWKSSHISVNFLHFSSISGW